MTYDEKLEYSNNLLRGALEIAHRPAVWCSFGKKSLVVLDIIQKLGHKPTVFWQRDMDPQGKRRDRFRDLVRKLDIEVMDYRPADYYITGTDDRLRLIKIYDLAGDDLPIIFPLKPDAHKDEDGWDCIFKQVDGPKREHYPYAWDLTVFGASLELTPSIPEDGFKLGSTLLCFPLRYWLRADVERYIKEHNVPEAIDPGEYSICAACIDPANKVRGQVYCPLVEADINWIDIKIDERNKLWESVISNG